MSKTKCAICGRTVGGNDIHHYTSDGSPVCNKCERDVREVEQHILDTPKK
jgi:hypothetical protein